MGTNVPWLMNIVMGVFCLFLSGSGAADEAGDLLDRAGIQGGLTVHLGCGDGTLTAALRVNGLCLPRSPSAPKTLDLA